MSLAHHQRVTEIQRILRETTDLDGWLFYDFRRSDPLAYRVLCLPADLHSTRRWYYWLPAFGPPVKLLHRIEPHTLALLPGECRCYVSWSEQHDRLQGMLSGAKRVAMQYSPMNAIPYIARVDAGTIELIRSFHVDVASSADLVQRFEAVWDERQLASHRDAAEALRRIVDEAFRHVRNAQAHRTELTEYDLQQFILSRIHAYGLITSHPPIAAIDDHSADPHYSPPREGSSVIRAGSLVLVDLWAKRPEAGSVYADMTWTGYVAETVPGRYRDVFEIVRAARDTAVSFVRTRVASEDLPCGWEVDDVCRGVIERAGFGDRFLHRTGHSIGEDVHGNGANIDNLETRDARRLLPRTCFSIEPGIYLPGEFGIRSELDVYVTERSLEIFGQPLQTEIVPILA
ncbi:M24 family metallopeptidase [Candidatus Nitrospira bockiana]